MPIQLPAGVTSVAVTGNKTLTAADSGIAQVVTATSTITLPATAAGLQFLIVNGGQGSTDGKVTISVSPAAADYIAGNGFTATDNKDAINTLGAYGDLIRIVGDGVNGYFISETVGTWTREA